MQNLTTLGALGEGSYVRRHSVGNKIHQRYKDAFRQRMRPALRHSGLWGPDQPAQSHEMSNAHQCVSQGLRVHSTYFTIAHSLGQAANISLADLAVVVEEGIW